ncbi:MAG: tyrosine-type recombinase/integrase [Jatrophihabitantaceae bacterium]
MSSSITKRPNGQWRARYRDADNREHARHFSRKVDGQRWLDEQTAGLVTGQHIDPRSAKVTLRAYAEQWEAVQVCRPATASITSNALRLHILPRLGNRPMSSILRTDVQALVKALSDDLAPSSTRNVYDTLTRVFGAAVDDRIVASSPCRRITLPPVDDSEIVPPTVEQVRAMVDAMPERYRAAVVLLAGSGLRIGELLGLQRSDVDFLRRTVRVERQRLQNGQLGPCKTGKSVRTVPLGQVVIDQLAAHLASGSVEPEASPEMFTAGRGQPLRYNAWKAAWQAACRVTGHELTTHDLRHFYASSLIAGGASVKQVQTVLGHASPVVTLRVYSHMWPGDDDRVRTITDATLEPLRTICGQQAV